MGYKNTDYCRFVKNVLNTLCLERSVLFYKEKQVSMNYLYMILYI